jgi:Ser/Thr protein kinase RdoA (MazF antagonist)
MMRFTTLWSLDRTADPETGRSPIADGIAAAWEHDPGTVQFFRSSANFIYKVSRNGRPAWLRIAAGSERSRAAIEQELDLLARLHEAGIPVVRPIPALDGRLVVTQETEIGCLHAVLFDHLDGDQRELEDLSIADMTMWGAAVGRLHNALSRAPDRFRQRLSGAQVALDLAHADDADIPEAVRQEARRLSAVLADLPVTPESYGLIHTDLELDNLRWRNGDIAALDFDEFGPGWYLLDIAKALTDPLREGDTLDSPRIAAFLAGYRAHRPLDDAMLGYLPDFLALSELRGYMSLARAIDIDEGDAGVEWMRGLIRRLRDWMREYEEGLVVTAAD